MVSCLNEESNPFVLNRLQKQHDISLDEPLLVIAEIEAKLHCQMISAVC